MDDAFSVHHITGAMKCFGVLSEEWQVQSLDDQGAEDPGRATHPAPPVCPALPTAPAAAGGSFSSSADQSPRWALHSPTGTKSAHLPPSIGP